MHGCVVEDGAHRRLQRQDLELEVQRASLQPQDYEAKQQGIRQQADKGLKV